MCRNKTSPKSTQPKVIIETLIFFWQSTANKLLIRSYQDLAKQLAVALQHEENRCGYLDSQKGMMTTIHEEMATMPEG